jgi:hypothetical protein
MSTPEKHTFPVSSVFNGINVFALPAGMGKKKGNGTF